MQRLRILSRTRETLATVELTDAGDVTLQTLDVRFEASLSALVEASQERGLALKTSKEGIVNGQKVRVDEQAVIMANDSRFLLALADEVNRHSFGGERAFAIVEKVRA